MNRKHIALPLLLALAANLPAAAEPLPSPVGEGWGGGSQ